ncbi:A1pp-domain-containing protein [Coprinopsis marcescibilis]|uniref:A1pp-domain-containing protein n=1 Tax=Coprinopsis marcescibilis TaxID=230819 RepID=A0A5C3KLE4_COPMA|nr:A1pp-domain-containing protein [Coprinopsis marcescibilis]
MGIVGSSTALIRRRLRVGFSFPPALIPFRFSSISSGLHHTQAPATAAATMSGSESESDRSIIGVPDHIDASAWTRISSMKTLAEMHREGTLKAPSKAGGARKSVAASTSAGGDEAVGDNQSPDSEVYTPNSAFLDRISLYQGDITKLAVDSIVNAANKSLLGGGGVDGAIHSAAGPKLYDECRQLNGCRTGQSKITLGYDLPSLHVIHTVGPVYGLPKEEKAEQLASCYRTSLELAVENQLRHIAFPSISTGIYGYPIEDATHIALKTTREFLEKPEADKIERVIFVVWSDKDKEVYQELLPQYFPPAPTQESSSAAETGATADSG